MVDVISVRNKFIFDSLKEFISVDSSLVLSQVKQFCFDNMILSGHSPKCVDASLYYLKFFGGGNSLSQLVVAKQFGVSTVALRNNVRTIRNSEYWSTIKGMLQNPNVERKV